MTTTASHGPRSADRRAGAREGTPYEMSALNRLATRYQTRETRG